ncbi:hypothetical protein B0J14DRAFT_594480 [Halenospora varia]|nr:hypothetical protein B0J14DRAFT_594480 [Halenospora varia]
MTTGSDASLSFKQVPETRRLSVLYHLHCCLVLYMLVTPSVRSLLGIVGLVSPLLSFVSLQSRQAVRKTWKLLMQSSTLEERSYAAVGHP